MYPSRNADAKGTEPEFQSFAKAGGLLSGLCPDDWEESSYKIDYRSLYRAGFRLAAFDIDNTLVRHNAPADEKSGKLFRELREMGFAVCLISNNREPRVKSFADAVNAFYVFKAGKPSGRGYLEACGKAGCRVSEMIFVGDQIFTDIWGARRAGARCILVNPIHPAEEIQIILKRRLEWLVLAVYRRGLKRMGKKNIPSIGFQEKK